MNINPEIYLSSVADQLAVDLFDLLQPQIDYSEPERSAYSFEITPQDSSFIMSPEIIKALQGETVKNVSVFIEEKHAVGYTGSTTDIMLALFLSDGSELIVEQVDGGASAMILREDGPNDERSLSFVDTTDMNYVYSSIAMLALGPEDRRNALSHPVPIENYAKPEVLQITKENLLVRAASSWINQSRSETIADDRSIARLAMSSSRHKDGSGTSEEHVITLRRFIHDSQVSHDFKELGSENYQAIIKLEETSLDLGRPILRLLSCEANGRTIKHEEASYDAIDESSVLAFIIAYLNAAKRNEQTLSIMSLNDKHPKKNGLKEKPTWWRIT